LMLAPRARGMIFPFDAVRRDTLHSTDTFKIRSTPCVEDRKFKRTFFFQRPLGKALDHPLTRSLGLAAAG